MKAKLIYDRKVIDEYDNIIEMVIWELPHKTPDRPHGYKYRCYFGNTHGKCFVRYDNERGKGDHKHIGKEEISYNFINVEQLIQDFFSDIELIYSEDRYAKA